MSFSHTNWNVCVCAVYCVNTFRVLFLSNKMKAASIFAFVLSETAILSLSLSSPSYVMILKIYDDRITKPIECVCHLHTLLRAYNATFRM